ncbi:MAG: hypothetical protein HDR80_06255 [Bacteroides sp.]|nr:hypothetical protein [Bacteroides sp.]
MLRHTFLNGVRRYWWLPLITGLLCIVLGVWTIFAPATALPAMAVAFAWSLILLGIFDGMWGLSTTGSNPSWGWDVVLAVIDVVAGVWMLTLNPAEMTVAFLYIIAVWIIFAAFNGVATLLAVSVRSVAATIFGILLLAATIFLSFWLLANPVQLGVLAWMWLGIALVCYGVFRVTLAFRIRNIR